MADAEMEQHFGQTSCLQLNVQGVVRDKGFYALCESLLDMVKAAADKVNLTTPALRNRAGVAAPTQLRNIFQTMDQPLAVQLDEVQWLLSPRLPNGRIDRRTQENVAVLLRDLLCYSSLYCQWAVTGSSMALFWVQLGLMPANGITPLTHKFPVHLPDIHSSPAKTQVLLHLMKRASVQHTQGQLPPEYLAIHDYADNCAMASFAFDEYDKQPGSKTIEQCLDDLDRGKVAAESKAEWSTVVKHELTHIQRRTLAGLYDTVNGCDLSVLGCQGLEEMLKPLTTEVMNGSSRRYLSNHFSRAGLAMCVTADGKVVDMLAGLSSNRSLLQIDAFVQMFLIGNKAKKLARDPAYYNNSQLLEDALKEPADYLEKLLGCGADQWRSLSWFQDVLLAAENQGQGATVRAADEAEVKRNMQGTAAAYLKQVAWHAKHNVAMPPEKHLAWYLCMLRNCLGHTEDDDYVINVSQATPSAFQLLAQSPVVQPSGTILRRFTDIRACRLT